MIKNVIKMPIIARQVGRFLIGQRYFTAFYQLTMVVTLLKLAWNYPTELLPILIILGALFIWALGYFADKTEFAKGEQKKVAEQQVDGSVLIWKEIIPLFEEMIKKLLQELEDKKKIKE